MLAVGLCGFQALSADRLGGAVGQVPSSLDVPGRVAPGCPVPVDCGCPICPPCLQSTLQVWLPHPLPLCPSGQALFPGTLWPQCPSGHLVCGESGHCGSARVQLGRDESHWVVGRPATALCPQEGLARRPQSRLVPAGVGVEAPCSRRAGSPEGASTGASACAVATWHQHVPFNSRKSQTQPQAALGRWSSVTCRLGG